MRRYTLKFLALLMVGAVAPASATHLAADNDAAGCPYERAKLAAAGYEVIPVSTEGEPAQGSLFDPGRRSVFSP